LTIELSKKSSQIRKFLQTKDKLGFSLKKEQNGISMSFKTLKYVHEVAKPDLGSIM
jgi:hypothetical protein